MIARINVDCLVGEGGLSPGELVARLDVFLGATIARSDYAEGWVEFGYALATHSRETTPRVS